MSTLANPLKVVLFLGSTRTNRLSDNLLHLVEQRLIQRGHSVTIMDARAEQFPMLDMAHHHYGFVNAMPEQLDKWHIILSSADAYVILDSEYNHSPTPGLLNMLGHFGQKTHGQKPAALITYSAGPVGGARSGFVLRNTLAELGTITIPKSRRLV